MNGHAMSVLLTRPGPAAVICTCGWEEKLAASYTGLSTSIEAAEVIGALAGHLVGVIAPIADAVAAAGLGPLVETENIAERTIRLLREAADALDELPQVARPSSGLLFEVTPEAIRVRASRIEARVAEIRRIAADVLVPMAQDVVVEPPSSTWPPDCPTCHAGWSLKSKTMGAAHGQPHSAVCVNGHSWAEGVS